MGAHLTKVNAAISFVYDFAVKDQPDRRVPYCRTEATYRPARLVVKVSGDLRAERPVAISEVAGRLAYAGAWLSGCRVKKDGTTGLSTSSEHWYGSKQDDLPDYVREAIATALSWATTATAAQ